MPDDTAALLFRLSVNINALDSAIREIGAWIEQRGSSDTSGLIAAHLQVVKDNSDFVAEALVELVSINSATNDTA